MLNCFHFIKKKREVAVCQPCISTDPGRRDKISNILYKTKEKAVSFLSTTVGMSCDLSWMTSLSRPHGVSLFGNIKRCVVVSFSGLTYIHESGVEHALCAFSGVYWEYFQVFQRCGCAAAAFFYCLLLYKTVECLCMQTLPAPLQDCWMSVHANIACSSTRLLNVCACKHCLLLYKTVECLCACKHCLL